MVAGESYRILFFVTLGTHTYHLLFTSDLTAGMCMHYHRASCEDDCDETRRGGETLMAQWGSCVTSATLIYCLALAASCVAAYFWVFLLQCKASLRPTGTYPLDGFPSS